MNLGPALVARTPQQLDLANEDLTGKTRQDRRGWRRVAVGADSVKEEDRPRHGAKPVGAGLLFASR